MMDKPAKEGARAYWDSYGLSSRTVTALVGEGLDDIDALARTSASELRRIPNFGLKSFREVEVLLAANGLSFAGEGDGAYRGRRPPSFDERVTMALKLLEGTGIRLSVEGSADLDDLRVAHNARMAEQMAAAERAAASNALARALQRALDAFNSAEKRILGGVSPDPSRARHEDTERSREQQDGGKVVSETAKS